MTWFPTTVLASPSWLLLPAVGPAIANPSFRLWRWWPPPVIRARRLRCGCRWDSNAETVRARRFGFREEEGVGGGGGGGGEEGGFGRGERRRWWSDESSDELDDDLDDQDDPPEQLWDRIWIFKVFKSYGYLLPAIIASLLLATGPKACLMALALPLGQSALSLAMEKVWGNSREWDGPRTKSKTKKKPFARSPNDFKRQGHKEERPVGSNRKGQGYQSRASAQDGAADKGRSSYNSTYGGWDDLDRQKDATKGSMRRQTTNGSAQAASASKWKISRRGRYRDVPLFVRLLIAVFPFLGSWTRIL